MGDVEATTPWSLETITRVHDYVQTTARDLGHDVSDVRVVSPQTGSTLLLADLERIPAREYGDLDIIAPHLTVRLTLGHVQVIMATAPPEIAHGLLALFSADSRKPRTNEWILGHWLIAVAASSAAATVVLAAPGPTGILLAAAALLIGIGIGVSITMPGLRGGTQPSPPSVPASRGQRIITTFVGVAVGVTIGVMLWASASAISAAFGQTL